MIFFAALSLIQKVKVFTVDVDKSSSPNSFSVGSGTLVENTPTPLAVINFPAYKYVEIVCPIDNSASAFIGPVGCPVGQGYEIPAGEKCRVEIDSATKIVIWSEDNSEDTYKYISV